MPSLTEVWALRPQGNLGSLEEHGLIKRNANTSQNIVQGKFSLLMRVSGLLKLYLSFVIL